MFQHTDKVPPSPELRHRSQKRQRRITAGSKGAARALPLADPPVTNKPAASAGASAAGPTEAAAPPQPPPAQQQQQQESQGPAPALQQQGSSDAQRQAALEAAWVQYVCGGRFDIWALSKPLLPEAALWAVHNLHPSEVWPQYYARGALPPGLLLPHVQPAAAAGPEAHASQAGSEDEDESYGEDFARAAAEDQLLSSSPRDEDAEDDGTEISSGSSSGGFCWCSECCGGSICCQGAYYTTSPESQRRQPGKRIKWRGAILAADPVRRNLMSSLKKASAAGADLADAHPTTAVSVAPIRASAAMKTAVAPLQQQAAAPPAANAPVVPPRRRLALQ